MSQPILISGLLKYFVGLSDFKNALIYSLLLSIGVAINCITHHVYYQVLMRSGMFMRIGLSGLIYKRVKYYYYYYSHISSLLFRIIVILRYLN
jgi:hypothetical protein